MRIFVSPSVSSKFKKITKKEPGIAKTIDRKLGLFSQNPNHPSLRLHKLTGKHIEEWSISVKGNLRITFLFVKEGIYITGIGTHEEVY